MLHDIPTLIAPEITPTSFNTDDGKPLDRLKGVTASEAHSCERKLGFEKHGYTEDEPTGKEPPFCGPCERGNTAESWFITPFSKSLLSQGIHLMYAGDEQVSLVDGQNSATCDGLLTNVPDDILKDFGVESIQTSEMLVEIKSLDPRSNFGELKESHFTQIQVQFGVVHASTGYAPEYAIAIYLNAADFADITVHIVKRDPKVYQAIVERTKRIFAIPNPMQLMAEGKYDGTCRFCNYQQACGEAIVSSFPEQKNPEIPHDVVSKMEELVELSTNTGNNIKKLKEVKSEADERLKILLREHDICRFNLTDFSVSYALVKGRRTLDTKALKAEAPDFDLDRFYRTSADTDRLTIRQQPK